MEATLFTFPSSKPPLSSPSQTLPLKSHLRNPLSLLPQSHSHFPSALRRRRTTIRSAISRTRKEETVETVKNHLQDCHLLAAIKYEGLTVKQLQHLRKSLPETTNLLVAKNTLVYKAIEGTQWEVLKPCMKGMNAWLFVHTEEIPAALKPYRDFQKEGKLEENDFTECSKGNFMHQKSLRHWRLCPLELRFTLSCFGP